MYFDIDAHKGCFQTSLDKAYFWHGQTNKIGGQNNAMKIAGKNGKTLEKCMLEHRDELEKAGVIFKDNDDKTVSIDYGNTMDESKKFWDDCSRAFAEQASGNVHIIEGSDLRPNGQTEAEYPSTYNRIERPTLEQNINVDSLTFINPANGETTGCEKFTHKNSVASNNNFNPGDYIPNTKPVESKSKNISNGIGF